MDQIPLRALTGAAFDPSAFKIHCAVFNGTDFPIEVLSNDWSEWVGWNQWRSSVRNDFNRDFIFSLAQYRTDPSLWLFGGVFEVMGRSPEWPARSYDVRLRPDIMGEYIKRLSVRFHKPSRNVRLTMENQVDQMTVESILPEPYTGAPFPGHDQINHSIAELQVVIGQNRPDWRIALQHMKGVYVIHDQVTGQPYVGAAYGDQGIWDRLGQYATTLHGGNVGLAKLIESTGHEYARTNLRFALLEFWSMRTEDQHVIDRETYWKTVLLSRSHGLNEN